MSSKSGLQIKLTRKLPHLFRRYNLIVFPEIKKWSYYYRLLYHPATGRKLDYFLKDKMVVISQREISEWNPNAKFLVNM